VVEATLQPIVQPIMQQVKETVVQPVLQPAEVVHVERAPIVNAPIQRGVIEKDVIVNKPVSASEGLVPASELPAVRCGSLVESLRFWLIDSLRLSM
jgi:hypothetical protein